MFDVCVVGSANLDLVAVVDRLPGPGETVTGYSYAEYPGGKGLNQAVAAARSGAATSFVGCVGRDTAAAVVLDVMVGDGIDTGRVGRVDEPTGRALIGVAASGENSIIVVAGANGQVGHVDLPPTRVILAQLEVPLVAVHAALAAGRAMGAITVLNPAPALPLPESLLTLCDIVVPNQHEAELMGGAARLLALGARAVVVTLGNRGADVHTAIGVEHIDPFAVTPVDTTAAGDSFCGSLCARLAAGDPLHIALRYAAAAGALCTTRRGAVPSIPHRAEIDRLLSAG